MRFTDLSSLALVFALLAGCTAHYPINEPFSPVEAAAPSVSLSDTGNVRSDTLLVGLAFSGGGTRAAALSYGISRVLGWIAIPSTSGSSLAASYFGKT